MYPYQYVNARLESINITSPEIHIKWITCAERECRARRPLTSTVLLSFIELGMCVYILSLNLCVILCTHEMLL